MFHRFFFCSVFLFILNISLDMISFVLFHLLFNSIFFINASQICVFGSYVYFFFSSIKYLEGLPVLIHFLFNWT